MSSPRGRARTSDPCPAPRFRVRGRRLCLGLAALTLETSPSRPTPRQGYCDPGLPVTAGNPMGYRARGDAREHTDRCEGVYVQQVAGTALLVASFTRAFGAFDAASGEPLRVAWPAVPGPVRVRAHALRPSLHYRMDTERLSGASTFTWPTSLLAALGIGPGDLGVVGWTERPVGPTSRRVYLPLEIRQRRDTVPGGGYRVVLLPGQELAEVYTSLAAVNAAGTPGAYLSDGVPLQHGFYPAGRAVVVPVATPREPGVYYLELAATLRGGGSATAELWFYHPGP